MKGSVERRADGEAKRRHIYETALRLFRTRGFAATTMRDVAAEAGVSLGAAYHYFASKEAIVFAYYDETQEEHEALARQRLGATRDLAERIAIVLHSKIDAVRKDRKLLVAIARSIPDPDDPLSVFSEQSRAVRERAVALFRHTVDLPEVAEARRDALALALWAVHMATLLYLVFDRSRGQSRTRELIDGIVELLPPLLAVMQSPFAAPMIARVESLLKNAGLLPPG